MAKSLLLRTLSSWQVFLGQYISKSISQTIGGDHPSSSQSSYQYTMLMRFSNIASPSCLAMTMSLAASAACLRGSAHVTMSTTTRVRGSLSTAYRYKL